MGWEMSRDRTVRDPDRDFSGSRPRFDSVIPNGIANEKFFVFSGFFAFGIFSRIPNGIANEAPCRSLPISLHQKGGIFHSQKWVFQFFVSRLNHSFADSSSSSVLSSIAIDGQWFWCLPSFRPVFPLVSFGSMNWQSMILVRKKGLMGIFLS